MTRTWTRTSLLCRRTQLRQQASPLSAYLGKAQWTQWSCSPSQANTFFWGWPGETKLPEWFPSRISWRLAVEHKGIELDDWNVEQPNPKMVTVSASCPREHSSPGQWEDILWTHWERCCHWTSLSCFPLPLKPPLVAQFPSLEMLILLVKLLLSLSTLSASLMWLCLSLLWFLTGWFQQFQSLESYPTPIILNYLLPPSLHLPSVNYIIIPILQTKRNRAPSPDFQPNIFSPYYQQHFNSSKYFHLGHLIVGCKHCKYL